MKKLYYKDPLAAAYIMTNRCIMSYYELTVFWPEKEDE